MADEPARRTYIAIDLKSFYASVECRERGLDPLATNLVVADASRTEKTICLAVSPALKGHGVSGRPRLFEVVERVREVNAARRAALHGAPPHGSSSDERALRADPALMLDYVVAPPQMRRYMDVSSQIVGIYLKWVAPQDMHVYSVDEVFIDATPYLATYGMSAHELARAMIREVLAQTGITATAGIGTNLYLAKVAMDIVAKHMPADADGVRIAELDEASYRRQLWTHRPLTDFWRVGPGCARRLEAAGMLTMGDVARRSLTDEELLYRMFGVNAEYLIDHAWGVEPTTIAQIQAYKPQSSSLGTGQVLPCAYDHEKCRIIVREMAEELSYSLLEKGLVTDQIALDVGFERIDGTGTGAGGGADEAESTWEGPVSVDWYGRVTPAHGHGTERLALATSSARLISEAALRIFERACDPRLSVRRITLVAVETRDRASAAAHAAPVQLSLFDDPDAAEQQRAELGERLERERRVQEQVAELRKRFGKNAVVKGTDLLEGARTRERNDQVGGHRA